jgi:hypothetical protein
MWKLGATAHAVVSQVHGQKEELGLVVLRFSAATVFSSLASSFLVCFMLTDVGKVSTGSQGRTSCVCKEPIRRLFHKAQLPQNLFPTMLGKTTYSTFHYPKSVAPPAWQAPISHALQTSSMLYCENPFPRTATFKKHWKVPHPEQCIELAPEGSSPTQLQTCFTRPANPQYKSHPAIAKSPPFNIPTIVIQVIKTTERNQVLGAPVHQPRQLPA